MLYALVRRKVFRFFLIYGFGATTSPRRRFPKNERDTRGLMSKSIVLLKSISEYISVLRINFCHDTYMAMIWVLCMLAGVAFAGRNNKGE